jgi:plasmid stabilization system protein ParE
LLISVQDENLSQRASQTIARSTVLGDFPKMERKVPELMDDRLTIIERPYRIGYVVWKTQVEILAVGHSSRGNYRNVMR